MYVEVGVEQQLGEFTIKVTCRKKEKHLYTDTDLKKINIKLFQWDTTSGAGVNGFPLANIQFHKPVFIIRGEQIISGRKKVPLSKPELNTNCWHKHPLTRTCRSIKETFILHLDNQEITDLKNILQKVFTKEMKTTCLHKSSLQVSAG